LRFAGKEEITSSYADRNCPSSVMPARVAGIHVLKICIIKDVDGRDKPGHDDG